MLFFWKMWRKFGIISALFSCFWVKAYFWLLPLTRSTANCSGQHLCFIILTNMNFSVHSHVCSGLFDITISFRCLL